MLIILAKIALSLFGIGWLIIGACIFNEFVLERQESDLMVRVGTAFLMTGGVSLVIVATIALLMCCK